MKLVIICAALIATIIAAGTAVATRSGPLGRTAQPPRATPMPQATGTFPSTTATTMRDGERPYNYSSQSVSQCMTRDLVICSPYWDVGNPLSKQSDLPPYGNQR